MRYLVAVMLVMVLISAKAYSQNLDSKSPSDEVGLQVLNATDYAELQRIVINKQCRKIPELAERQPACAKVGKVPNLAIEKMMLPYFTSYVSENEAKAALVFWSSPEGARISKKLLREIADDNPTLLSEEELGLLNQFNKSEAGVAMSKLAQDRTVAVAVIRAIRAYEP